jgi:hypothetical protein
VADAVVLLQIIFNSWMPYCIGSLTRDEFYIESNIFVAFTNLFHLFENFWTT